MIRIQRPDCKTSADMGTAHDKDCATIKVILNYDSGTHYEIVSIRSCYLRFLELAGAM